MYIHTCMNIHNSLTSGDNSFVWSYWIIFSCATYEKISLVISVHSVLRRYLLNCSWMSLSLNCLIPFSNSLTFVNIAFNLSWSSLWVLRLFWAVEAIMLSNTTCAAARPDLFSKLQTKMCETWDSYSEVYGNHTSSGMLCHVDSHTSLKTRHFKSIKHTIHSAYKWPSSNAPNLYMILHLNLGQDNGDSNQGFLQFIFSFSLPRQYFD